MPFFPYSGRNKVVIPNITGVAAQINKAGNNPKDSPKLPASIPPNAPPKPTVVNAQLTAIVMALGEMPGILYIVVKAIGTKAYDANPATKDAIIKTATLLTSIIPQKATGKTNPHGQIKNLDFPVF